MDTGIALAAIGTFSGGSFLIGAVLASSHSRAEIARLRAKVCEWRSEYAAAERHFEFANRELTAIKRQRSASVAKGNHTRRLKRMAKVARGEAA